MPPSSSPLWYLAIGGQSAIPFRPRVGWVGSMAVRASIARFPADPDAQEAAGLLWGITVTPFAAVDELGNPPAAGAGGDVLPRCENCWAYFSTYCELEQWSWTCAICGTLNGLTTQTIARYSRPDDVPELCSSFVDLELPGDWIFSLILLFWFFFY